MRISVLLILILLRLELTHADKLDADLLNSLKIEANHNLNRLKSLDGEVKNRKVFDREREKSLGLFLEEQEKWDLQREKGIFEFKKNKKVTSPQEGSEEYLKDQKEKNKAKIKSEKDREIYVRTRNQVLQKNTDVIAKFESEELGLTGIRPRYELRKRGQNKWVKSNSSSRPSVGDGYSQSNDAGFPPPPPPQDYIPAPPPAEGYEEIPPPPQPIYDYGASGMPYDAGYGDIPPPPPPPPPPDYDF